ncbi:MAG: hypothetical protein AAGA54_33430 [Myxococcota bacterium]
MDRWFRNGAKLAIAVLSPIVISSACAEDECRHTTECAPAETTVHVEGFESAPLPAGTYEIAFSLDNVESVVECEITGDTQEDSGSCGLVVGPSGLVPDASFSVFEGTIVIQLELSHGNIVAATTYAITVRRNDTIVKEQTGRLETTETYPAGPGCVPVCTGTRDIDVVIDR